MLLPYKTGIVYGPVQSRRLGVSLGINLLPGGAKWCTFNCQYCQYGYGRTVAVANPSAGFPSINDITAAVEHYLKQPETTPQYLTFSGNGEPTLHPDFPAVVEAVSNLRDRLLPAARLAILSNATTVSRDSVRCALSQLDVRIMKLDAGTPTVLRRYNQPHGDIHFSEIVDGLKKMDRFIVQSLFSGGKEGNSSIRHVEQWVETVQSLAPDDVQIYSLDRDFPSGEIHRLQPDKMEKIAALLEQRGIRARVY